VRYPLGLPGTRRRGLIKASVAKDPRGVPKANVRRILGRIEAARDAPAQARQQIDRRPFSQPAPLIDLHHPAQHPAA